VYLGSLTREKRIPTLVDAADELAATIPGFRLLVIGDGPLREEVRTAAATRPWLRALGALHGIDKALACSLGDVMLNPGMVGLNIVDAFAMGLPLVTMRHDLHSPEIAYLESGRNGLMADDNLDAFIAASKRALADVSLRETLLRGCRDGAARYTLERMAQNFAEGIVSALRSAAPLAKPASGISPLTVAVVVRTFLPYHVARIRRLREALAERGVRLCSIEVASRDAAYGFAPSGTRSAPDHFCCFPDVDYQSLTASEIHRAVLALLETLRPDVVIGHATPFPEGMAAIAYRNRTTARVYVVDDAWEATDRSSALVRSIKRVIHRSVDGAIVSSAAHVRYYAGLGVPQNRSACGCSVVDNETYARRADLCRRDHGVTRGRLQLPTCYFLFVGRFLERKGISNLLRAYELYRAKSLDPWPLVLIGGDPAQLPRGVKPSGAVRFAGRMFGDDLADALALAGAVVVPSLVEQWGLVINEAMAAGTLVIASRACGGAQLVRHGETGFTYEANDVCGLAELLQRVAGLSDAIRAEMGRAGRRTVSGWGLDRFVDGVSQALRNPRREPGGIASRIAVRLWKGRVRPY
jgi:glycosyltransferase involved in cell wall biosynthesis